MITFSSLGKYGRLGNQLFQYSILKSVSLQTNYEIVLNKNIFNFVWHGQKCLLNNFKLKSANYGNPKPEHYYREKMDSTILSPKMYDKNVYNVLDNTDFFGYFQNAKYYEDIRILLRDELEMSDRYEDYAKNYLSKFNNHTVSLHVRRGDVSNGTNKNCDWSNDFSEGSTLKNYYQEALNNVPEDSSIILFTGGNRNNDNTMDYEWCKKNFNDNRIIMTEEMDELETFSIMTKVDTNIIGFKSTFSWWGGFLNKNESVIAPKNFNPTIDTPENIEVYPSYFKTI